MVMSVFSSDTDPDMEDELCRFQSLAPVPPLSTNASMGVVKSPTHYPTPAVPVVSSAVSYVRASPGRDREVSSSVKLDVFPVYDKSPDILYYLPATSTVTSPFSGGGGGLLPLLGPESLPLGAPASLDSLP